MFWAHDRFRRPCAALGGGVLAARELPPTKLTASSFHLILTREKRQAFEIISGGALAGRWAAGKQGREIHEYFEYGINDKVQVTRTFP